MLGSPVPMVPLPGAAASALESYSRFLVSERARDRKIELEREREIAALKSAVGAFQVRSSIYPDAATQTNLRYTS